MIKCYNGNCTHQIHFKTQNELNVLNIVTWHFKQNIKATEFYEKSFARGNEQPWILKIKMEELSFKIYQPCVDHSLSVSDM